MKLILISLLLVVCCAAQTITTAISPTPASGTATWGKANSWQSQPDERHAILMIWTSREKCYGCNFRYAMACPGVDCNVPLETVEHYGWFETIGEAIKQANDGQFEVASISKTTPLKFGKEITYRSIPQPPQVNEVKVYSFSEGSK